MKLFRSLAIVFSLFAAAWAVCACGGGDADGATGGQRSGATPRTGVICTTVPVYSLAVAVAGSEIPVRLLPNPHQGSHTYNPTLRDRERLFGARAVLANGLGLEPWLDAPLRRELAGAGVRLVETAAALPKERLLEAVPCGHDHAEHDHDAHAEHDPHVWLCAEGIVAMLSAVEGCLSQLEPTHAAEFAKRAAAYRELLNAEHARAQAALKAASRRSLVTFHDAWRYFARDFGLEVAEVVMPRAGQEGSLKHIERVKAAARAHGALFVEPQFDASAIGELAREAGAKLLTLDPGETSNGLPTGGLLIELLKRNAGSVVEGLVGGDAGR